jgi:hypothetical protein
MAQNITLWIQAWQPDTIEFYRCENSAPESSQQQASHLPRPPDKRYIHASGSNHPPITKTKKNQKNYLSTAQH